jgi:uncharacterized protein with GYD domain
MLEEMGGTFRLFFMTMGAYDLVLIYGAPDDAISARLNCCSELKATSGPRP